MPRALAPALVLAALGPGPACAPPDAPAGDDAAGSASKADELDGGSTTDGTAPAVTCRPADEAFAVAWPAGGPGCDDGSEPDLFLHEYDTDTFLLRQSLCTSFEAPFVYLLFGEDRVLVQDSGAGGIAIFDAVRTVVDQWLAARGRTDDIEILLVNSHAHGDHVAGNGDFEGRPGVTVVGFGVDAVRDFFGIRWPDETAEIDLGGRVVDLVPIPGHEASHIALYDRRDGLLLTGDAFYPGRLFIEDFDAFVRSNDRLVQWADEHPVCWVLGNHIEMSTTPGDDYEFGVTHHPDEHVLQLTPDHLREAAQALHAMDGVPRRETHDDFVIFPL